MSKLNATRYATADQRHQGRALAAMLPLDRLELVDPAAGAADDIKAATATVAAPVTLEPSDLKSAGLTKLAVHGARSLTFTTAGGTPSDAPASATITGKDVNGNALAETLNLAQTAAAVETAKCFSDIESITYPAADGTDATVAIGIGDKFALPSKVDTVGGGAAVIREVEDGAVPGTAGTFADPSTSAPNGAYTPNSTPDGSKDFAVWYERDVAGQL